MTGFLLLRLLYTLPLMVGVALVCFTLVHLAPGDPLVSVLPPDASAELQERMREMYGFNRSYPEQFASWVGRALQGDLGMSIASGRPVADEVMRSERRRIACHGDRHGLPSRSNAAGFPGHGPASSFAHGDAREEASRGEAG